MQKLFALFSICLLALAACSPYQPTPHPDYSIKVVRDANGVATAVPPECPSWAKDTVDPYDNQPVPQFGCANARNLALMVDRPEDLVKGRDMGPASAVTTVGAIRRYNNNQTRGLMDLDTAPDMAAAVTTAPTASSSMTGEVTGASPAAAAPAAAAAP